MRRRVIRKDTVNGYYYDVLECGHWKAGHRDVYPKWRNCQECAKGKCRGRKQGLDGAKHR